MKARILTSEKAVRDKVREEYQKYKDEVYRDVIRWGDSIIQAIYKKGFKDGQYDLIQTLIERYEMPEDSKLKEILCKQNERKQGYWLVYRSAVKCSICKTLTSCLVEKPDFRYCPHCGARMFSEETT